MKKTSKHRLSVLEWLFAGLSLLTIGGSLLFYLALLVGAVLGVLWLIQELF